MKKGYKKCTCCGEPFDYENLGFTAEIGDDAGKPVCENCWSDDGSDPVATIIWNSQGDRDEFWLGNYSLHGEWDESMRPEVWEYARLVNWQGSGGYRGSYQGKAIAGWVNVIDDWFGTIDGANVEDDLAKFHKKWQEQKETPEFDMIVAFPRTSNVCACGIEVYVREADVDQFKNWLDS
jgi:hypothetical protein